MKRKKRQGFWEKIAHSNIGRAVAFQDADELFVLTEKEAAQLSRIEKSTFIKAGLAGALGVILLYVPYYVYGDSLFPLWEFTVPYLNREISVRPHFLGYSAVLVILEIWYLTYMNIKAVSAISHACGHPNPTDKYYKENLNALVAVGIEKKEKQLESIGINPFNGLSKFWVLMFYLLTKAKAALSNFVFTFLVKRLGGRFALRQFIDFAGIPVYMFWNIWGAKRVMDETRVRAMAPPLILRCVDTLYTEQKENLEFKEHIYDMLQMVSESKRSFHYNHFLLSIIMLSRFDVEIQEEPKFIEKFIDKIPQLSRLTQEGFKKLFVFGIMIDGKISYQEKKSLRHLYKQGIIPHAEQDVIKWSKDYYHGRGIEHLFGSAGSSMKST